MSHDFSPNGYRSFLIASKKCKIKINGEPDNFNTETDKLFELLTTAIQTIL